MKTVRTGGQVDRIPEDSDTEMWVENTGYLSLQDMINRCKAKWPNVDFEDISVEPRHHHQYCIYYDLHDSSDYVDYLVFTKE
jgi:hypothetical protein